MSTSKRLRDRDQRVLPAEGKYDTPPPWYLKFGPGLFIALVLFPVGIFFGQHGHPLLPLLVVLFFMPIYVGVAGRWKSQHRLK